MTPMTSTAEAARTERLDATARSWLPLAWGLLVIGVAGQVVYPHLTGSSRDAMTVATVVLFAGAGLVHAAATRGLRAAASVLGVFAVGGLLAELIGVATGFPFGTYHYDVSRLGPSVGDVPLLIPLAWAMLGWPAAVLGRTLAGPGVRGVLVSAGALTAWDLYLDPQMVAEGYWTWIGDGPHLIDTIPVTNYLGWLLVSGLMMAALRALDLPGNAAEPADRLPLAIYLWTWIGSGIAHVFYLDLPLSGVYGLIGMGLFAVPWLLRSMREAAAAREALP